MEANVATKQVKRKSRSSLEMRKSMQLITLAIPGAIWFLVFCYFPMVGAVIAFKDYKPKQGIWGSEWVGLENFKFLFSSNDAGRLVFNTMFYNFLSIFLVAAVCVVIAILMDLVEKRIYLKTYKENPARNLYQRVGFKKYGETETHWLMER